MSRDKLNFQQKVSAGLVTKPGMKDKLPLKGKFKFEHWRQGVKIGEWEIENGITNEGKNKILDVMFSDATQIAAASWYIGLIDNDGFTSLAAGDTMSSHAGWNELTSEYDETTRPAWGPGNPASQSITNASPVVFTFNGTADVYGAFITSNNTKGGTTGTLWSTGAFNAVRSVVALDEIRVNYTLSC